MGDFTLVVTEVELRVRATSHEARFLKWWSSWPRSQEPPVETPRILVLSSWRWSSILWGAVEQYSGPKEAVKREPRFFRSESGLWRLEATAAIKDDGCVSGWLKFLDEIVSEGFVRWHYEATEGPGEDEWCERRWPE